MLTTFKAMLVQPVSYTDREGRTRTLPAGISIEVSRALRPHSSNNLDGTQLVEPADTLYGSIGDDSFDVSPTEIAPLYN